MPVSIDTNRIAGLFAENFERYGEIGASVSIWRHEREIVSLAGGWCDREKTMPWTAGTAVLVYSATKGPAAACVLHALEKAGLSLEDRVAGVWPEFGAGGKSGITFGQLLSHQAGLPALSNPADVLNHPEVVRALEEQPPFWSPGEAHGYHPRTIGFLADEIVRRVRGVPLGDYWRAQIAEPLELDFWIGLPEARARQAGVAPISASRTPPPKDSEFARAFASPGSLTAQAFTSPRGLNSVAAMNTPEARQASLPAFGGIGTAGALAKFYALLANEGELDGWRLISPQVIEWMSTTLTNGFDKVLQMPTAFSAGFMQDPLDAKGRKLRRLFGPSQRAFGQPGAGGSMAFADPENGVAFAYVMNQMEPGVLPNAKSLRLIDAIYGA